MIPRSFHIERVQDSHHVWVAEVISHHLFIMALGMGFQFVGPGEGCFLWPRGPEITGG